MSYEDEGEIDLNYDAFVADTVARNNEDSERAQSAGESRQKIKEFLEETGLHPKVYSFGRMVLKQKKFANQSDMIRSMKEMLPHVEAYVFGNNTPDMFDQNSPEGVPVDFDEGAENNVTSIKEKSKAKK